jgi:hypothetical protein
VLKARGIAKKADVIMIGTVLHFDSVLARVLDPKKSPGWRGKKYRSVIRWSERQDLWQEWQTLYTDWSKPDSRRLADAEAFFDAYRGSRNYQTLVYTGGLRFSRKLTELYDQLRYFPQAAHDDGPDAVALCMEVIDNPGPRVLNLDAAPAREKPLHPFDQQLRAAFGDIFDPPDDVRCGTYMHLVRRPNGRTFCDLRKLYTAATEYACSEYDYNYEGF